MASSRLRVTSSSSGGRDTLQATQPVGEGRPVGLVGRPVVVPAGPRPPVARQQAGIGVEGGPVGLVPDGAEYLALRGEGSESRFEGLVAVGGHHDLVEPLRSGRGVELHLVGPGG